MHGAFSLDHSYAGLSAHLSVAQSPVPVAAPTLVLFNRALAIELGLDADALDGPEGAALFAGNVLPSDASPIAQAYAGHQFGHFTMLGDGRAVLLGEQLTPTGMRMDIQLKGSGRTPFSRSGDGRAALGPMLREYMISEAMHALGIPTTRSLAVVTTGEPVLRETALPGAVLTRVAASHLRVGTFEYVARLGDPSLLRTLADYAIARHYPHLSQQDAPYLAFLEAVIERQAALVAQWMAVGFVHGVMNTDNMTISGETIDYGPCAFLDTYDPATVFSSIDRHGRYAFGNQATIAQWNLARFAETLLPLLHHEPAQAVRRAEDALGSFPARFQHHWLTLMRRKLGLTHAEENDAALIADLLELMANQRADYTATLRALNAASPDTSPSPEWHARWQQRLSRQSATPMETQRLMQAHNPATIPRNQHVEEALAEALVENFQPLRKLLDAITAPYIFSEPYSIPNATPNSTYRTFCGT